MNQPDRLPLQSPDLVSGNVERIAELFPNCVTEGEQGKVIDFDLLRQELSRDLVDGPKERYRLEWPGKRQAIVMANLPTTKTLRPVREDSVDFDTTQNLYIEGDNLEVLKLLQESYLGKVKMIYIDPPYNTGKDFVYRDNFTQNTDEYLEESGQRDEYGQRMVVNPDSSGRYHSDWLSMMYPRLKLARNLLSDQGIVFISIDDNEVNNLKKVGDEIFGESNFRGMVSRSTGTPSGQGNDILVNEVDYVLVFSKSPDSSLFGLPFSEKDEAIYDKQDEHGRYLIRTLRKTGGEDRREDRPSMYFELEAPDGSLLFPIGPTGYDSRWRCGKKAYERLLSENRIEWQKGNDGWKVFQKFYLEGRMKQPSNLWQGIEGNKKGSITVKELLKGKFFDAPKPVELIEKCINISCDSDDLILDFFSGSATTAHAVIKANASDSGNRRFIQVQLPESTDVGSEAYKVGYKNICDIGKERIRRAAKKIKEELTAEIVQNQSKIEVYEKAKAEGAALNAEKIEEKIDECRQVIAENQNKLNTVDFGFRVYRLAESNMQDVYHRPHDLRQETLDLFADNVKPDRTADDLLAQVMLAWGLPLSLPIERAKVAGKEVYRVAENSLLACFDKGIDEAFAKEVAKEKPLRILFRDSGFKDDTSKENVRQLLKQLSPDTEMRVI